MNLALLAKLSWKIASGEDNICVRMLRARYLKWQSFFEYLLKKGCSVVWQGIIHAGKALKLGACYKIADGFSINMWIDLWVPS